MSVEFIDRNFERWIRTATIEEDNDRLQMLRAACSAAAKDLARRELEVVLVAHGEMNESALGWLGGHLRAIDESFVAEGKDELLGVLAGVAVMERVLSSDDTDAALCALAACSAEFAGMTPVLDELPQIARARLADMGQQVRETPVPGVSSFSVKVPSQKKAANDAGEPTGIDVALADVYALGQSVKKLSGALDASIKPALARQLALGEEVEMLWWVVTDADENGERWSGQSELGKAVKGAVELAERTRLLPEPPSGAALLGRLLGKAAAKKTTLSDLATEVASQEIHPLLEQEHSLLPIASACQAFKKFSTDEDQDTWQRAVQNQLKLDPKRKCSLSQGSLQLYRELQMMTLMNDERQSDS